MSSAERGGTTSSSSQGEGNAKETPVTSQEVIGSSKENIPSKEATAPDIPSGESQFVSGKRPHVPKEDEPKKPAAIPTPEPQEGSKLPAQIHKATEVARTSSSDPEEKPRQVIAVSASKGPAAFFNLARKFLVTDEYCDLSALEGAIVSAVDAVHLLERSKLATIVRIQTSYVTVEPKRKKQLPAGDLQAKGTSGEQPGMMARASTESAAAQPSHSAGQTAIGVAQITTQQQPPRQRGAKGSAGGKELRRARIVITVRRTESYKQWLEENPLQAILAGDADEPSTPDELPSGVQPT